MLRDVYLFGNADEVGRQIKPCWSDQTADRAASVSAYVGLISAVHTLTQIHLCMHKCLEMHANGRSERKGCEWTSLKAASVPYRRPERECVCNRLPVWHHAHY